MDVIITVTVCILAIAVVAFFCVCGFYRVARTYEEEITHTNQIFNSHGQIYKEIQIIERAYSDGTIKIIRKEYYV